MARLVLFGPGYTGSRLASSLQRDGWQVDAISRHTPNDIARAALGQATHVLSTVPPGDNGDPILPAYGDALRKAPWIGYLSSTGVYGDTKGAWVDESAALGGRRDGRIAADQAWAAIGARVFRLPGIYGPGRAMLERLKAGQAHRIDLPGQVFCRIHVDDIIGGVRAAIERGPAGVYNLADDRPAPQNDLVEYGCGLLGLAVPPLRTLDQLDLSPQARAFYSENRRVANEKAKRLLGWRPLYPSYREGLAALV
ncbi:MAG TPA: SDR family NAD(P)-dependent oxidoreductase [Sphingomonas sp.]|uniref:SDR family NAD(P)-dependent oxidoreductase n=1 Tax=Sphingomonas sp. TaxID=28214 RepID=UPI002C827AEF|nr:SDR family NAD(P)-dependent oxidoreductase [Sphingomonas sp.]HMI19230.1 SDR family NAD(P)-dependent oxidoreductase [Sphingomonas sp.]